MKNFALLCRRKFGLELVEAFTELAALRNRSVGASLRACPAVMLFRSIDLGFDHADRAMFLKPFLLIGDLGELRAQILIMLSLHGARCCRVGPVQRCETNRRYQRVEDANRP